MFATLLDLVLPTRCAGCTAPGAALCDPCAAALSRPFWHAPAAAPPGLPAVCAAGRYEGAVRAAILAYKERGRRELSRVLGGRLAAAVAVTLAGPLAVAARVVLVPVPSRAAAARARGGDHVRRLAEQAAVALRESDIGALVLPALRLGRTPRDAAGLTAAERAVNVRGAFVAARLPAPPPGPVVVVDDLVTTGSTLAEVARALRVAGLPPAAAAVVAATIRRRPERAGWPVGGRTIGAAADGHYPARRGRTSCPGPMTGPEGAVRDRPSRLASTVTQGEEASGHHRPGSRATPRMALRRCGRVV
jgi:predicted amidophosphoribosyltransferase